MQEGYFVALDKVDQLGYFIEIENRKENDSIEVRNSELIQIVQGLGLDINKRNREGYSNMLYRKIMRKDSV